MNLKYSHLADILSEILSAKVFILHLLLLLLIFFKLHLSFDVHILPLGLWVDKCLWYCMVFRSVC